MTVASLQEESAVNEIKANEGSSRSDAAQSAQMFKAAIEPSYARTLFFGSDGLRPGWGFAFYAVSFLVLQKIVIALAWSHNFRAQGLWSMLLEEAGDLAAALIPAIVLARIEKRAWRRFGLPANGAFGKIFWVGALWGFAAISGLMLALWGVHSFSFGHVMMHGVRILRFGAFWALFFLLVGVFEEFLFRGYSLFTLARGIGFWRSAIALSAIFGLVHRGNGGEHWTGLCAAGFIGFFFCFTLWRTGTLWFAVGFHAAWDWGETFFYSVPDSGMVAPGHLLSSSPHGPDWLSGGSVGPEGSIFCFVIVALTGIIFHFLYPRTNSFSAQVNSSISKSA